MTSLQTLERLRALIDAPRSLRAWLGPEGAPSSAAAPPTRQGAPLDRPARAALQQALRLLAIRGYSTLELRQRLLRKHEPAAADAALASLAGTPFLDDAAWAAARVAGLRGRERSGALLRRELASKGITPGDATAALAAHDDAEAALAAARKRVGALSRLGPEVRRRRLRDYLLRRGFSVGTALAAIAGVEGTLVD